jgi:tRNA (cmo5U34)-methyltransferase
MRTHPSRRDLGPGLWRPLPRAQTPTSLVIMDQSPDTNAAIWKSEEGVQFWTAKTGERRQKRAAQWQFMGEILPFAEQDEFTFLDLGAGTGAAAREILDLYPRSTAILTDFSARMMGEGEREMQPFAGRFQYLEFDMSTSNWPAAIPAKLDAIGTSMCIHHLPDHRKQGRSPRSSSASPLAAGTSSTTR